MKFLTVSETLNYLGLDSYVASVDWYRSSINLKPHLSQLQTRVTSSQPNSSDLSFFCQELIQWLGGGKERIVWISRINSDYHFVMKQYEAYRNCLGENRSISEVPGNLFENISPLHCNDNSLNSYDINEYGLLVSLLAGLIVSASDGVFLSKGNLDLIEFWEGNIIFY